MEEEQSFKQIKNNPETQLWLDEHIVLNKQFVSEARRFGIKPLTNEFWVYQQHRSYEKFGKFGFCVAGVARIAEDCELTKKQVLNAYNTLMNKGAILHIWSDTKVYRNKTKVYVSQVLIEEKRIEVSENMLARTYRQKQLEGDQPLSLDQSPKRDRSLDQSGKSDYQSGKSDYQSGKSDYQSGKSDLNNYSKQIKCSSSDYDTILEKVKEFQKSRGFNPRSCRSIVLQMPAAMDHYLAQQNLSLSDEEINEQISRYLDFMLSPASDQLDKSIRYFPHEMDKRDFLLVDRLERIIAEKEELGL